MVIICKNGYQYVNKYSVGMISVTLTIIASAYQEPILC